MANHGKIRVIYAGASFYGDSTRSRSDVDIASPCRGPEFPSSMADHGVGHIPCPGSHAHRIAGVHCDVSRNIGVIVTTRIVVSSIRGTSMADLHAGITVGTCLSIHIMPGFNDDVASQGNS